MQITCVCNTYKMNMIKLITYSVVKAKTYLNLLLENMLELIVYLTRTMKINQLDLNAYVTIRFMRYADAYILVNGMITVAGNQPRDRQDKQVILKNNAPFVSCITRINGELIEDADDLDIVMPMYNLLEYSKNYRKNYRFIIQLL